MNRDIIYITENNIQLTSASLAVCLVNPLISTTGSMYRHAKSCCLHTTGKMHCP